MQVVYGLQDPRDNSVFYVGVTGDLYTRYIAHIRCEDENAEKNQYIHELKAAGLLPIPLTLQITHTAREGREAETYWITHYRRLGARLCNHTHKLVDPAPTALSVVLSPYPAVISDEEMKRAIDAWQRGARGVRALQRALGITYHRAGRIYREFQRQGMFED